MIYKNLCYHLKPNIYLSSFLLQVEVVLLDNQTVGHLESNHIYLNSKAWYLKFSTIDPRLCRNN